MTEVASRCVRDSQNYQAPDATTPASALPAAQVAAKQAYQQALADCFPGGFDTNPLWDGTTSQTATEPLAVMLTLASDRSSATFVVRVRVTGPEWKFFHVSVSCDHETGCLLRTAPKPTAKPTLP